MYKRFLDLTSLVQKKSLFLLGPRQTGKSTLLKQTFSDARYIDLLEADTFREYSAHPELIRQRLREDEKLIIVDEVQKLPSILDEIQLLMDRNPKLRFILTGSSARKLRRGRANLLGGRAWTQFLHPLISSEIQKHEFEKRIVYGSLPGVLSSNYPKEDLTAYVGTYLKEEILAEGLTRSIENFSRFLEVAGLCSGEQVNFESIGNDAQIPPRTVSDHFQILEDTLLGKQLPVFQKSKKRKAIKTPKFYFFDVGVTHALKRNFQCNEGSSEYGKALEHLIYSELDAWISYHRSDEQLTYWRTGSQLEVDFILGDRLAIEVKAKRFIRNAELKALIALGEEFPNMRKILVCLEKEPRMVDGIEILPVQEFLDELWGV